MHIARIVDKKVIRELNLEDLSTFIYRNVGWKECSCSFKRAKQAVVFNIFTFGSQIVLKNRRLIREILPFGNFDVCTSTLIAYLCAHYLSIV